MSGILPYFKQLRPGLSGAALAQQIASDMGVHYSTVYKWLRFGMASAEAQHLLRLAQLLHQGGHDVSLGDLQRMCAVASDLDDTDVAEVQ
jgi:hypothetical protein